MKAYLSARCRLLTVFDKREERERGKAEGGVEFLRLDYRSTTKTARFLAHNKLKYMQHPFSKRHADTATYNDGPHQEQQHSRTWRRPEERW